MLEMRSLLTIGCAGMAVAGVCLAANGSVWLIVLGVIPAALAALVNADGPELAGILQRWGRLERAHGATLRIASAAACFILYTVAIAAPINGSTTAVSSPNSRRQMPTRCSLSLSCC